MIPSSRANTGQRQVNRAALQRPSFTSRWLFCVRLSTSFYVAGPFFARLVASSSHAFFLQRKFSDAKAKPRSTPDASVRVMSEIMRKAAVLSWVAHKKLKA